MSFYSLSFRQDLPPKDAPPSTGGATTTQPSGQQGSTSQGRGGFDPTMMIMMLGLVGFMFFMTSRQKKQEAKERSSLKRGDRVVSQTGLIGELVEFDDKIAKVNIAPGVKVQMLIGSISPLKGKEAEDAKDAKGDKTPAVVEKK